MNLPSRFTLGSAGKAMNLTPKNLVMYYIAIVLGVALLFCSWEWRSPQAPDDPDQEWRSQGLIPIWSPPTISQIHQRYGETWNGRPLTADGLEVRISRGWLPRVLVLIFPAFLSLKRLAKKSVQDRKLRFLVTSLAGVYWAMPVWFVVWMSTSWTPPPIYPYCGIGLLIGVIVAWTENDKPPVLHITQDAASVSPSPPRGRGPG